MASEREKLVARHNASAPAAAVERAAMLREPFGAVGDVPAGTVAVGNPARW
jgi:hypothetical protein